MRKGGDSGCDGARVVEAESVLGQQDGSVKEAARMKPSARATGARRACCACSASAHDARSEKLVIRI